MPDDGGMFVHLLRNYWYYVVGALGLLVALVCGGGFVIKYSRRRGLRYYRLGDSASTRHPILPSSADTDSTASSIVTIAIHPRILR